jgi:UDP:flavonoid glycosyltransferase YjiC (YdhE family)
LRQALTHATIRRVSRFLLVVSPLQGYLYPMLAIGRELVYKEHEVIWCGPDNAITAERVPMFDPMPRLDVVTCQ